jgi:hypothetical protein
VNTKHNVTFSERVSAQTRFDLILIDTSNIIAWIYMAENVLNSLNFSIKNPAFYVKYFEKLVTEEITILE